MIEVQKTSTEYWKLPHFQQVNKKIVQQANDEEFDKVFQAELKKMGDKACQSKNQITN